MLVDFAGLPGSGKTTLAIALETAFRDAGHSATGLRNLAISGLQEKRDKIGFLRNRGERTSLWGLCAFAQGHPGVFQRLFDGSRDDFKALIWHMEMLALLGMAAQLSELGEVILNDEGFVQRGAMAFLDHADQGEFNRYVADLPLDVVTVLLNLTPEMAVARAAKRKKGLTPLVKGADAMETLAKMRKYQHLMRSGVDQLRARGATVLELDAETPAPELAKMLLHSLTALMPREAEALRWPLHHRTATKVAV